MTTAWDTSRNASGHLAFSNTNTTITYTGASGTNSAAFSTILRSAQKWIVTFTASHSNSNTAVGFGDASASSAAGNFLGIDTHSFAWQADGDVSLNNTTISAIDSWNSLTSYTLDLAFDFGGKLFWGRVGSGNWNGSALNNPTSGVGGIDISGLSSFTLSPAGNLFGGSTNDSLTFVTPSILSGFQAWLGVTFSVDALARIECLAPLYKIGKSLEFSSSYQGDSLILIEFPLSIPMQGNITTQTESIRTQYKDNLSLIEHISSNLTDKFLDTDMLWSEHADFFDRTENLSSQLGDRPSRLEWTGGAALRGDIVSNFEFGTSRSADNNSLVELVARNMRADSNLLLDFATGLKPEGLERSEYLLMAVSDNYHSSENRALFFLDITPVSEFTTNRLARSYLYSEYPIPISRDNTIQIEFRSLATISDSRLSFESSITRLSDSLALVETLHQIPIDYQIRVSSLYGTMRDSLLVGEVAASSIRGTPFVIELQQIFYTDTSTRDEFQKIVVSDQIHKLETFAMGGMTVHSALLLESLLRGFKDDILEIDLQELVSAHSLGGQSFLRRNTVDTVLIDEFFRSLLVDSSNQVDLKVNIGIDSSLRQSSRVLFNRDQFILPESLFSQLNDAKSQSEYVNQTISRLRDSLIPIESNASALTINQLTQFEFTLSVDNDGFGIIEFHGIPIKVAFKRLGRLSTSYGRLRISGKITLLTKQLKI